jgi:hypothetical protein
MTDQPPASEAAPHREAHFGAANPLAEKLIGSGKKCQGTTSVVPQMAHSKSQGFSP